MENQSSSSLIEANPKKDPVLIYEYDVKQESPLRVAFRRVVEKKRMENGIQQEPLGSFSNPIILDDATSSDPMTEWPQSKSTKLNDTDQLAMTSNDPPREPPADIDPIHTNINVYSRRFNFSLTNMTIKLDNIIAPSLVVSYLISILVLFITVNRIQPTSFIDELFHIPQAQQYCQKDDFISWDPKLTTPPGLYIVSYAILRPLAYFYNSSQQFICSIVSLRFTNVLFAIGNVYLIFYILNEINYRKNDSKSSLIFNVISICLLPPLYFFTFLYYTDPGSMFTILLTQSYAVEGRHEMAALSGFVSLWFRQTNIVWIFLLAGLCCLSIVFNFLEDVYSFKLYQFYFLGKLKRFPLRDCRFSNWRYLFYLTYYILFDIISTCGGYILDAILFVAFLYLNNGIVLGDRSAHQASLHLAQIPYFLTFLIIFAWPWLLTLENFVNTWNILKRQPILFLAITSGIYLCLTETFTYVHPYLLADNRHYVFYIWRRFWSNPTIRFAMVPAYSFVAISAWNLVQFFEDRQMPSILLPKISPKRNNNGNNSNNQKSKVEKTIANLRMIKYQLANLLFLIATSATIVPQQLIEFRYFLVPYIMWRIHLQSPLKQTNISHSLFIEMFWFIIVNVSTFILFTTRTIHYSDDEPNQRLIW
ncbi:glucosyltransferase [Blomia tropicalis]|nr:glucosyltransferase [Blomia tropicalis]